MEPLRSTLFNNQIKKNRVPLFLLTNTELNHSILIIWNKVIPFCQIHESNIISSATISPKSTYKISFDPINRPPLQAVARPSSRVTGSTPPTQSPPRARPWSLEQRQVAAWRPP
jgi:hypothetical protein